MKKITPFLWFDTKAEEAANFYISVFKNSKILGITRYGEAGPGPAGTVMVVDFELDGQRFNALNGGPLFKFTEAVSFVVECETSEELDYYWEKLSEGSTKAQCGWLKDKYGLSWQIVPTGLSEVLYGPDPAKSKKAMEAMMRMSKLDLAALRAAYDAG